MSLTLLTPPGFTEIPDANFAAGATASDTDLKALNADAKFAAVRNEQFWGFYKNGDTVALPVSPADGYTYGRTELVYSFSWWWTGSCPSVCAGTQTPPTKGATSGPGTVLQMWGEVNQATGVVTTQVSYYKTSQTDTGDGVLLVIVHALRGR